MKNFSGVCQAAGADKPLRAFFIWITNIVTLSVSSTANKITPPPQSIHGRELYNVASLLYPTSALRRHYPKERSTGICCVS